MTVDELAAATGSKVAPMRAIVYMAQHSGKEQFLIGNFMVDRHAKDEEILALAIGHVEEFYQRHLPDGTPRPNIVNFHKGALHLYLED